MGTPNSPVSEARRDPDGTYDVREDECGGEPLGLYKVNHGYYGTPITFDPLIPRWVNGNGLARPDAHALAQLRAEVSHAVLSYFAQTGERPDALGLMLGLQPGLPRLRLQVAPNGDGSFEITPYDLNSAFAATVTKGRMPQWERRVRRLRRAAAQSGLPPSNEHLALRLFALWQALAHLEFGSLPADLPQRLGDPEVLSEVVLEAARRLLQRGGAS